MSDLIKQAKERLDKSYAEPVESMSTVYVSSNPNYFVQVNPDHNRLGNEHFKVYGEGSTWYSAKKMNRISFWKPEYVEHSYGGKEPWFLNAKEKRALVKHLKEKSGVLSANGSFEYTRWQATIAQFNLELGFPKAKTEANLLNTPTYNKCFLPFNLPMPNYLEL